MEGLPLTFSYTALKSYIILGYQYSNKWDKKGIWLNFRRFHCLFFFLLLLFTLRFKWNYNKFVLGNKKCIQERKSEYQGQKTLGYIIILITQNSCYFGYTV